MTTTQRNTAIERLNRLSDLELFDLLEETVQHKLQTEFVNESLDQNDREEAIFSLIDEHEGKDRDEQREHLSRRWVFFLESEKLRETYAEWLEAKVTEEED